MPVLSPLHKIIIRARYGLNDSEQEKSLEELSKELGFSKEKTRQLELQAIKILKHPAYREKLLNILETMDEIGDVLMVTRERVRQIEASAIKKLKHPKIGKVLKGYMEG